MVGLAQSSAPFGSVMSSVGSAWTAFAFTGEQLDGTGLVCTVQVWRQLRAECIFYGREPERSRAGAGQGQAARPDAHARAAGDEVEAVATDGPTSPEGSRCIAPQGVWEEKATPALGLTFCKLWVSSPPSRPSITEGNGNNLVSSYRQRDASPISNWECCNLLLCQIGARRVCESSRRSQVESKCL